MENWRVEAISVGVEREGEVSNPLGGKTKSVKSVEP